MLWRTTNYPFVLRSGARPELGRRVAASRRAAALRWIPHLVAKYPPSTLRDASLLRMNGDCIAQNCFVNTFWRRSPPPISGQMPAARSIDHVGYQRRFGIFDPQAPCQPWIALPFRSVTVPWPLAEMFRMATFEPSFRILTVCGATSPFWSNWMFDIDMPL